MIQRAGQRPNPNRHRCFFDISRARSRDRLPRRRPDAWSARTRTCSPTASTPTATRSSSCASATCAPGRTCPTGSPAATTAGPGAPTRSGSSTPCTTRPTGRARCWRHRLGTDPADDVLVLEEPDAALRAQRAADPQRRARRDLGREPLDQRGLGRRRPHAARRRRGRSAAAGTACSTASSTRRYDATGDRLLVVTNDGAVEFRLMTAPVPRDADQDPTAWVEARPERSRGAALAGPTPSRAASCSRSAPAGEHRLRVVAARRPRRRGPRAAHGATTWAVSTSPATTLVRRRRRSTVVRRVLPAARRSGRRSTCAPARRTEVHRGGGAGLRPRRATPWSGVPSRRRTARRCRRCCVRRRDTPLDGTAPALLYAYGAYEAVDEPEWDAALPSLLDRGVVWVHALIRGGGEGGRRWWLDGSLRHKQHTFDDLAAVADGLARDGLVDGEPHRHPRPERRRAAPGRGVQPAARPLAGGGGRGAVRRRGDHDVRRVDPADRSPSGRSGATRAVREEFDWMLAYSPYDNLPRGRRPPRPAGHRRRARPPGDGARAGEVGRRAARTPTRSGRRACSSAARPARAPMSARPGGSATSATRPRSMPGSSTAREPR